ncbi:MAG: Crp/Fnr family transcriptional regulator [Magnetospirillum sp.]|nr:Crp/Fnr family transcriptional regulator [Magnetospirillum sp.]
MAENPTLERRIDAPGKSGASQDDSLAELLAELFPHEAAKPVPYRKRAYIFHQGDPVEAVWCIVSGMVALERIDDDGRMAIFGIMKAGTVLAWQDLMEGGCYRNSAETLSPCDVIAVPCATFRAALHRDDRLVSALMRQVAAQVGAYEEHILRLSTLEVPERLYSTLCSMASSEDNEGDMVEFSVPILRRDLAAMIGTSPEGVSRGIRRLEEMNVAEFSGRSTVRLRVPPRR